MEEVGLRSEQIAGYPVNLDPRTGYPLSPDPGLGSASAKEKDAINEYLRSVYDRLTD